MKVFVCSDLEPVAMPTPNLSVSIGGFPEGWCVHVCVGGGWEGQ